MAVDRWVVTSDLKTKLTSANRITLSEKSKNPGSAKGVMTRK